MTSLRPPLLALLAVSLLLAFAGCGDAPSAPPRAQAPAGAVHLDAERWLGKSLEVSNLVVWPVYTSHALDLGEFRTLEEAEAEGKARVLELQGDGGGPTQQALQIDDQGPTVGTLMIENDGDLPILVVAGTIVKGGQQDRQIGQDLVIAAHTKVPVEAFCVESGRWQSREGMDGVAFKQGKLGIATKKVRAQAQYAKDQQGVWNEVQEVLNDRGIQATSTFVAAVEEEDPQAKLRRDRVEQTLRERFAKLAATSTKPVGFAYAVNGKIQTVRAFAHPRLLADHLPAFVKAMALEADLARDGEKRPVRGADVAAFVLAVNKAAEAMSLTNASNTLGRRENDVGYNGNCYLADPEDKTKRQALTVDWTSK